MGRQRLRRIFFEIDIFPFLPSLRLENVSAIWWKRAFLRQLCSCVSAGIDLPRSLDICLKERLPFRMRFRVKSVLGKVKAAVEEGQTLSEALRRHAPIMFPKAFYGAIEIGEKSGTLGDILKILESRYESISSTRGMIQSTMIYPFMILLVSLMTAFFLLIKVVPTFAEIFADLGASLPVSTQMLVGASRYLVSHMFVVLLLLICSIIILSAFVFLARRIDFFSRILLRLPFVGTLLHCWNQFHLSNMMSVLLGSGATTFEAMSLCEGDIMSPAFRKAMRKANQDLAEGKSLHEALAAQRLFSSTFLWLISVGEQKGNLSDSLLSFSEFETAHIEGMRGLLLRVFEPAMLLSISFGIGFLVVAMWAPILCFSSLPLLQ